MRHVALAMLAACGGSPPREAPKPANVTRASAHTSRDRIVPGMLGDPGVLERIPERVRLGSRALPLIGKTSDRLRVVGETDDARIAEWIDASTVAIVATADAQLTDQAGAASHDVGIWVLPGAPLALRQPSRDRQEVHVETTSFAYPDGWLEKRAIGTIYVPVREPRPTQSLVLYTPLRAGPSESAAVVADTSAQLGAIVLEQRGAWRRVEVVRDLVRVRGWVPADAVLHDAPFDDTIDLGSIYTVSHATRIEVPAGTCLYDHADGVIVGVNTKLRSRLGQGVEGTWERVFVKTIWGLRTLAVHFEGSRLESCLP